MGLILKDSLGAEQELMFELNREELNQVIGSLEAANQVCPSLPPLPSSLLVEQGAHECLVFPLAILPFSLSLSSLFFSLPLSFLFLLFLLFSFFSLHRPASSLRPRFVFSVLVE